MRQPAVSRLLTMWSDGQGYQQAIDLATKHEGVIRNRLSPAQLSGLRNAVGAAAAPTEVLRVVNDHVERAQRRGESELRQFWFELGGVLRGLADGAKRLRSGLVESEQTVAAVESIHLQLIRRFVQHFVVHSLYLRASSAAAGVARDERPPQRRR